MTDAELILSCTALKWNLIENKQLSAFTPYKSKRAADTLKSKDHRDSCKNGLNK